VTGGDENVAMTHVGGALRDLGGRPADRAQRGEHVCHEVGEQLQVPTPRTLTPGALGGNAPDRCRAIPVPHLHVAGSW